jgi:cob(I)alamin adenosyltransferase
MTSPKDIDANLEDIKNRLVNLSDYLMLAAQKIDASHAAEIERLKAENEQLRAALKHIARVSVDYAKDIAEDALKK